MPLMAAIVKELISAGVTGDALVTALERIESAIEDPISAAAARQRRYRKRNALRNVTLGDAQKEKSPTPPKEKTLSLLPFSEVQSSEEDSFGSARARGNSRATRLPDDWQPSEADLAFAAGVLLPGQIAMEADKFRDHWHAANGPPSLKRSWSAAWRTWCRRAVEFNGNGHGKNRAGGIGNADQDHSGGGFASFALRRAAQTG